MPVRRRQDATLHRFGFGISDGDLGLKAEGKCLTQVNLGLSDHVNLLNQEEHAPLAVHVSAHFPIANRVVSFTISQLGFTIKLL
jgi:hypothetical protein